MGGEAVMTGDGRLRADIVTVEAERDSTGHRFILRGRLDTRTAADTRLVLHRLVDDGADPILLDLGACQIGDATGLGLLVEVMRRASRAGRRLHIVAADERTQRLLRRARLGQILAVVRPQPRTTTTGELVTALG